jgi:hypothetical protein
MAYGESNFTTMASARIERIMGGSGAEPKQLGEADKQVLEAWVEADPQTYSTQLAHKLEQERRVTLSPDWIRRVMKKGFR